MNGTVEAIRNGQMVTPAEAFSLVGDYEFSILRAEPLGGGCFNMNINSFKEYNTTYEFGQLCSEQKFSFSKDEIESVETEYIEEMDDIFVTCNMKCGATVTLIIYGISTNQKLSVRDDVQEICMDELTEIFDSMDGQWFGITKIRKMSGIEVNMKQTSAYIGGDDEEPILYISSGMTSIEIPVFDDSCNEFYLKRENDIVDLYVKPYEQAFTEIHMRFVKFSNQSITEKDDTEDVPAKKSVVYEPISEKKKEAKIVSYENN